MPARDRDHDAVKQALIKESWQITHDPYVLAGRREKVFVDLAAEWPLAAEKEGRRIAIEIKGFRGHSSLKDFQQAIGQYMLYLSLMRRVEPGRELFLAIPEATYENTFQSDIARAFLEDVEIRLMVFRAEEERIVKWIP